MRVLALVSDAYNESGGIAHYNRRLIQALAALEPGTEVLVLPRVARPGSDPIPTNVFFERGAAGGAAAYLRSVLASAARLPAADLIVCGHIHLLPLAELLRIRFGAPVVIILHGVEAWTPRRRLLTDLLARRARAITCTTELTRQRFFGWTGLSAERTKVFELPPPVDLSRFAPGPKPTALRERYGIGAERVLLTVARLSAEERYKGIDRVCGVLHRFPDVRYLVVGDGGDRPRLEQHAQALGVLRQVIFAGFVPEEEKVDHYRLADAFVMPSTGEGFGIVFLEAAACGIPVVGSEVDGSKEPIGRAQLGVTVQPEDPESLARGISQALLLPRGRVPPGLSYYSAAAFDARVAQMAEALIGRALKLPGSI